MMHEGSIEAMMADYGDERFDAGFLAGVASATMVPMWSMFYANEKGWLCNLTMPNAGVIAEDYYHAQRVLVQWHSPAEIEATGEWGRVV